MAPSVEIKVLNEARESARAAAEASGLGRRARAPSRKVLEMSGLLEHEGPQWLTKEIKERDGKLKRKQREQRKQLKAAGLKQGEVIEAFSVDQGSSLWRAVGGNVNGGGIGDDHVKCRKMQGQWHKPTRAELMQVMQAIQGTNKALKNAVEKTDASQDGVSSYATGTEAAKKRKGTELDTARCAEVDSIAPKHSKAWALKKSRHVNGGEQGNTENKETLAAEAKTKDSEQNTRISKKKGGQVEVGGEGDVSGTFKYKANGHTKAVVFGVDDAVRYW